MIFDEEEMRMVREYLSMSQTELAERAGITQPHVFNIEHGNTNPSMNVLKEITEVLQEGLKKRREQLEKEIREISSFINGGEKNDVSRRFN